MSHSSLAVSLGIKIQDRVIMKHNESLQTRSSPAASSMSAKLNASTTDNSAEAEISGEMSETKIDGGEKKIYLNDDDKCIIKLNGKQTCDET